MILRFIFLFKIGLDNFLVFKSFDIVIFSIFVSGLISVILGRLLFVFYLFIILFDILSFWVNFF